MSRTFYIIISVFLSESVKLTPRKDIYINIEVEPMIPRQSQKILKSIRKSHGLREKIAKINLHTEEISGRSYFVINVF